MNWFHLIRNSVPTVTVTAPSNGATFRAPASIAMNADAFDPDGSISKVEFYNGTTLLGTDHTAPYSFTWGGVPGGSYSLTATAFDNFNQITKSEAITVTVAPSPPGAAQWFIGSGSAYPGETISVPVWFAGDGVTSDASVDILFEVSRLGLPVPGGALPDAAVTSGAYCYRVGANRIRILTTSSGNAAPSDWTQLCQITFSVATNAPSGNTALTGMSAQCAAMSGEQPCAIYHGQAIVLGSSEVDSSESDPPNAGTESESTVLALISPAADAPTPEMLQATDFQNANSYSLLEALNQVRPRTVSVLMHPRASGDFAAHLRENPRSPRAILERYIVVRYGDAETARRGLAALLADRQVEYAMPVPRIADGPAATDLLSADNGAPKNTVFQDHLIPLDVPAASQLARGWSLVGAVDSGMQVAHPGLRAFSGGTYVRGNHLPVYDKDFGDAEVQDDANVDEKQPVRVPVSTNENCPVLPASDPICSSNPTTAGRTCMIPQFVGHGTHVSGLIGANAAGDVSGFTGTCPGCGVAMAKAATAACSRPSGSLVWTVSADFVATAVPPAMGWLTDMGSQVINLSLSVADAGYCTPERVNDVYCVALAIATANDVLLVASSGNSRKEVAFPASDSRVISVGGLGPSGEIWDRSPGTTTNCPPNLFPVGRECGSNFTIDGSISHQELVAPAQDIFSLMYQASDYNTRIGCGDNFGGPVINAETQNSDGVGTCTGTSMSAPMVAGIAGLVRSINPLVRRGSPETGPSAVTGACAAPVLPANYGVRSILAQTTDRAGLPWDPKLGYGQPNAKKAVERMLGRVRGDVVANRVTPLFLLYSPAGQDFLNVASPQAAMAFSRFTAASYTSTPANLPQGEPIRSYPEFPNPAVNTAPRAGAYVLATEQPPSSGVPAPVPLYWLDRAQPLPGFPAHRDSLLMTSAAHVEFAVSQGYSFRGVQGYVYPSCPDDACMPFGTQKLYRQCNTTKDDCAVFLHYQRDAFIAQGYTAAYPEGSTVIGYAYPPVDSDNDGLVDGMEYIIGTASNDADSDDDNVCDGMEFPQAGVAISDPCTEAANNTCARPQNPVFANGFE